jgi:sugar O-acyltransferase (sialic acid O-acetyltransferase NeuD family)
VIFGAASQARLADRFFSTDSDYDVVAFTVDGDFIEAPAFRGRPLVAFEEVTERYPPDSHAMFVALGYTDMNRLRAAKVREAAALGYRLASYVSSRCTYLTEHEPGANCLILEDNTVQPFVRIGDDVTLWSGNHIGHDVEIGDHVFISSHVVISGFTRIGAYSFLGVNATLRDDIVIGEATLVGAGAVITRDTEPGSVWVAPRSVRLERSSDQIRI